MQEPSIFTRIINGEIPAHKIYEDDRIIAFLDMLPINEGHTLVVPKKQVDHIWDLDQDEYDYLWKTAKKISNHIWKVLESPRVGAIVEGFGVPHAHIHIVPIYNHNDLQKPTRLEPTHEALANMAARLKM
jgi:histidine triad (HIT) family protein